MALKGINVIEMAGLAPVPFCGTILADFGAHVTKVDSINSFVSQFDVLMAGKRSVLINLRHKDGANVLRRLAAASDVLIDPYRPGKMEKLGLGPDQLMKTNKRLIYARVSGYGEKGMYSGMAGHDINYLALSGLLSLYGWRGKHPVPPANSSELSAGSVICALGIVMALLERHSTGRGQFVDANITASVAYAGTFLTKAQATPIFDKPRGCNWLDGGAHFYDTYETADGKFMAVGAIEPKFYEELLRKLNLDDSRAPQFENMDATRQLFAGIFKAKTQQEWCRIFDGSDACVTPVLSLEEASNHPQNVANGTFLKDDQGKPVPRPAPTMSSDPQPRPPTCLGTRPSDGQHTIQILEELGYQPNEIDRLLNERVVRSSSPVMAKL